MSERDKTLVPLEVVQRERRIFEDRSQKVLEILKAKDDQIRQLQAKQPHALRSQLADQAEQIEVLVAEIAALRQQPASPPDFGNEPGNRRENENDDQENAGSMPDHAQTQTQMRQSVHRSVQTEGDPSFESLERKDQRKTPALRRGSEDFANEADELPQRDAGVKEAPGGGDKSKGVLAERVAELESVEESLRGRVAELEAVEVQARSTLLELERQNQALQNQLVFRSSETVRPRHSISSSSAGVDVASTELLNNKENDMRQESESGKSVDTFRHEKRKAPGFGMRSSAMENGANENRAKGSSVLELEAIVVKQSQELVRLRRTVIEKSRNERKMNTLHQQEVGELQARIAQLEADVDKSSEQKSVQRKHMESTIRVLSGKSDLHAKLGQLSERLGSVLEERSAVSSQLRAVKSENSKLRNQLTSVSKKYDKLEGKLGSLQSLEAFTKAHPTSFKALVKELVLENDRLRDMLDRVSAEVKPTVTASVAGGTNASKTLTMLERVQSALVEARLLEGAGGLSENKCSAALAQVQTQLKMLELEAKANAKRLEDARSKVKALEAARLEDAQEHEQEVLNLETFHGQQLKAFMHRSHAALEEVRMGETEKEADLRCTKRELVTQREMDAARVAAVEQYEAQIQALNVRVETLAEELSTKDAALSTQNAEAVNLYANESVLKQTIQALEKGGVDAPSQALLEFQEKLLVSHEVEAQKARLVAKLQQSLAEMRKQQSILAKDNAKLQASARKQGLHTAAIQAKLMAAEAIGEEANAAAQKLRQEVNRSSLRCIDVESELAACKSERGLLVQQLDDLQASFLDKLEEEVRSIVQGFSRKQPKDPHFAAATLHLDKLLAALPQQKLELGLETLGESLLRAEKERLVLALKCERLEVERNVFNETTTRLQQRVATLKQGELRLFRQVAGMERRNATQAALHSRRVNRMRDERDERLHSVQALVPTVMDAFRSMVEAVPPPTPFADDPVFNVDITQEESIESRKTQSLLPPSAAVKSLLVRLEKQGERVTQLGQEVERLRTVPVVVHGGFVVNLDKLATELMEAPETLRKIEQDRDELRGRMETLRLRVEDAEEKVQAGVKADVKQVDQHAELKQALLEAKRELVQVTCEYETRLNATRGSRDRGGVRQSVEKLQQRCIEQARELKDLRNRQLITTDGSRNNRAPSTGFINSTVTRGVQVDKCFFPESHSTPDDDLASANAQVVAMQLAMDELESTHEEKVRALELELESLRVGQSNSTNDLAEMFGQTERIAAASHVETIKRQQQEIHALKIRIRSVGSLADEGVEDSHEKQLRASASKKVNLVEKIEGGEELIQTKLENYLMPELEPRTEDLGIAAHRGKEEGKLEGRLETLLRSMPGSQLKSQVVGIQHMLAKVAPELFDPDQQEEELRNALIELEKQVETSNQQNRDARKENEALEKSIMEAQARVKRLQGRMAELENSREQGVALQKELASVSEDREVNLTKIQSLSDQLTRLTSELNSEQKRAEEAEKRSESLEEQLAVSEEALRDTQQQLEMREKELCAENDASVERIAALEAEHTVQDENRSSVWNDRVQKLEQRLGKAKATIKDLRESLASVKAKWIGPAEAAQRKKKIAKLKGEVKGLRDQLRRKSEFIQAFSQKQKSDNEREIQLSNRVEYFKRRAKTLETDAANKEKLLRSNVEKLDSLLRVKAEVERSYADAQEKMGKLTRERAVLKSKVERLEQNEKKTVTEAQDKTKPLEKRIEKMRSKSRGLNNTLLKMKKDKSQAVKALHNAQEQLQQVDEAKKEAERLCEDAKAKAKSLEKQLAILRKDLATRDQTHEAALSEVKKEHENAQRAAVEQLRVRMFQALGRTLTTVLEERWTCVKQRLTTQSVEKLGNVDQMASVLEMSKGDVCDILSADLSQLDATVSQKLQVEQRKFEFQKQRLVAQLSGVVEGKQAGGERHLQDDLIVADLVKQTVALLT